MKVEKNILVAFVLNLFFSLVELIGGLLTNSVAIMSDSIHDLGDAISIGISYFLEKLSKKKPDNKYSYGYVRYSVIGSLITTVILIVGSLFVIFGAIKRLGMPKEINSNGMIILAIFGLAINTVATYATKGDDSLNKKAVNLHMLEDVLGWAVVLIGSILIKITGNNAIDSLMSIGVSLFVLIEAFKNLESISDVFLEKVPANIDISELEKTILDIDNVHDVHHIHVWTMDGVSNYATMHVVTENKNFEKVKKQVKDCLNEKKIEHVTIELENLSSNCKSENCSEKDK